MTHATTRLASPGFRLVFFTSTFHETLKNRGEEFEPTSIFGIG